MRARVGPDPARPSYRRARASKIRRGPAQTGPWTVYRYLDTGDAKSMSSLRRHAKNCWDEEAVQAADNTEDLASARVILTKTKLRDGSITAKFERIGKGKVTYSHRQHTSTKSR